MIQVIAGKKGSGKTKRLIDMTNKVSAESPADVVFLDKDDSYTREISHKVRFVNAEEYHIHTPEMFVGFVAGMLSQNFDIGTIFIDAFIRLCRVEQLSDAAWLFQLLEELSQKNNVNFVISVSEDPDLLPDFMKGYVI